jgi:hypothetical protein
VVVRRVVRGECLDRFIECRCVLVIGVLLGLHRRDDDCVVLDEALSVICLARFDALREVVITDRADDTLRVLFFIQNPACCLIDGLCVLFTGQFGQLGCGFADGLGIFQHIL